MPELWLAGKLIEVLPARVHIIQAENVVIVADPIHDDEHWTDGSSFKIYDREGNLLSRINEAACRLEEREIIIYAGEDTVVHPLVTLVTFPPDKVKVAEFTAVVDF